MKNIKRWLQTNTFHHSHFADVSALVRVKEQQKVRISLCIPTLNEAGTISALVTCLRCALQEQFPLLDEIAVIDSGSADQTLALAAASGASVYCAVDLLPEAGARRGKGENLWKAVYQLHGDILVFLDADITNMHIGFVVGLLGPLLLRPEIAYVKSCYERPDELCPDTAPDDGGRVTEILMRPFFSLYYPELTAFIQPLSGEYAARRDLLESLAFPIGYGIEAAHLIDTLAARGLFALAQTDLDKRCHRRRSNRELGRMAYAILQVLNRRLPGWPTEKNAGRPGYHKTATPIFTQFIKQAGVFHREEYQIVEEERPPLRDLPAYQLRRATLERQQGGSGRMHRQGQQRGHISAVGQRMPRERPQQGCRGPDPCVLP